MVAEKNSVMFCPSCGEMQTEGSAKLALSEGRIGFELCPHCRKDSEANVLDGRLMKFWHALSVLTGASAEDPVAQAALLQVAAMLRMMQYLNAVGQVMTGFATAFLEGISPLEEEEQPEEGDEAEEEPEAEGPPAEEMEGEK